MTMTQLRAALSRLDPWSLLLATLTIGVFGYGILFVPNFFTDNYAEPIIEDGIACVDMIRLRLVLTPE